MIHLSRETETLARRLATAQGLSIEQAFGGAYRGAAYDLKRPTDIEFCCGAQRASLVAYCRRPMGGLG